MSDTCKAYIRSLIKGDARTAFQSVSMLEDKELFRGLDVIDRADLDDLFDGQPDAPPAISSEIPGLAGSKTAGPVLAAIGAAAIGARVFARLSQMNYGYKVVKEGKAVHRSAPTDTAAAWAKSYIHDCMTLHRLPLEIDEDLTGKLPAAAQDPGSLANKDFDSAAATLGVDVPAIQAVAKVESSGSGFGPDNLPVIRFELHKFHKKTHHRFHKTHPYLSQPSLSAGNPYHNGTQSREYTLLYNAMIMKRHGRYTIDEAIQSASWGKFQIMGEHWSTLGWSSPLQFASDMYVSEANQLKAFVKFVDKMGLTTALKNHDWAGFAKGYNGVNYSVNQYDQRLQRNFEHFSKAQAAAKK